MLKYIIYRIQYIILFFLSFQIHLICQILPTKTFDQYYDIVGETFGKKVTITQDINGDNVDDFLISQPSGFNEAYVNAGRIYVYFGREVIHNGKPCDLILAGVEENENFGISQETFDINGDDFFDIIVGAKDKVYIFFGGINFDNTPDLILEGEAENDDFGKSLSTAGDVNNDGYSDLLVGAYHNNLSGFGTGRVYLYYGGPNLDNIPDKVFIGSYNRTIGFNVGAAGDLNKDGFDDILINANDSYIWGTTGYVYILHGDSILDNTFDDTLSTGILDDGFGSLAIESVGDINHDGFNDIMIGGNQKSYLYFGGENIDSIADSILDNPGLNISNNADVNSDGNIDMIVSSSTDIAIYFGKSIFKTQPDLLLPNKGNTFSTSGDINNDGVSDIIIGGSSNDVNIYFGNKYIDASPDIYFSSQLSHSFFGQTINASGDINNDGSNDIIIGAPGQYYLSDEVGAIYLFTNEFIDNLIPKPDKVIYGSRFGFARSLSIIGDINNDGFDDFIIGSPYEEPGSAYIFFGGDSIQSVHNVKLTGEVSHWNFGTYVSKAGDFNNDEFDDIIISSQGRAYLYLGGVTFDTIPDLFFNHGGDYEPSIMGGGDINNDGIDDIMIGDTERFEGPGKVYVYYGGTEVDTIPDIILNGEFSNSNFGLRLDFIGYFNNDEFADIIVSSDKNVKVYFGGSPMDTIPDLIFFNYGLQVSGIGDFNNDGFDDFLIDHNVPHIGNSENIASIFLGGANFDTIPDYLVANISGNNYWKSYCPLGDYNNDGYDDFLVGAPGSSTLGNYMGQVYLYSGGIINKINDKTESTVTKFKLFQNYPNPFNPKTTISFHLPKFEKVNISIFNSSGQQIDEIVNKKMYPGQHYVIYNGFNLSSGIYFYKITAGNFSKVKKMLLIK